MYCTQADIEERFGQAELVQLTDRTRTGQVDATTVARAITDASAELEMVDFLKSTGAVETSVQVAEEGWWYGRWDKPEPYEQLN